MAFADVTQYNRVRAMKGLPVGTIIPWASDQGTIPTGWTVCNGSTISQETYPVLYSVIGTVYGGTAGSTFKLPPLTQGGPAVVDQYIGHYPMLSDSGYQSGIHGPNEAHKPDSNSGTGYDDPYWEIVGRGTNGDTGNNSQTFWISTLDLVGVENSTAVNFQGLYDDMEVSDGSYFFIANYSIVELGVEHKPSHSHGDPTEESTSYSTVGSQASRCSGTGRNSWCNIGCDATSAWRVARDPGMHVAISRGNNQSDLRRNYAYGTDGRTGWTARGGGGGFFPTTAYAETIASVYRDGDGFCAGNMRCGNDILFTSKSHDDIASGAGHQHGPNNYTMEGKYQVISPGLRTNIALNTVRINNSPGQNFGTINVETATPSLEMLYIIRAF